MFSTISGTESADDERLATEAQVLTLIALSLLSKLREVDGIFVTHFVVNRSGAVRDCRDWMCQLFVACVKYPGAEQPRKMVEAVWCDVQRCVFASVCGSDEGGRGCLDE